MVRKGIVYYTDNRCEERIANICRNQISKVFGGPIVSVSHYPINFGYNIVMDLPRCSASIFKQILMGLEHLHDCDTVFLCEHDVLYSANHFTYEPANRQRFYYNLNRWQVSSRTGEALYRKTHCTSLCISDYKLLYKYMTELNEVIKAGNYSRKKHGFAPGAHSIKGVEKVRMREFTSDIPCIDIRHDTNFTPTRWNLEEFNDPHAIRGWKKSDEVPYWGVTKGRFNEFLREVAFNGKL